MPLIGTPQRIQVFWMERPQTYLASCNVCGWVSARYRTNRLVAGRDCAKHRKECSG